LLSVPGQVEAQQVAVLKRRCGSPDDEIAVVLWPEGRTVDEADGGRRERKLPTELGIPVFRGRQHEEARQGVSRVISDVGRRPAFLLKIGGTQAALDRLEVADAIGRAHELNPSEIRASFDSIQLVEAIVSVLLVPQIA
jgi:hypothetical protein